MIRHLTPADYRQMPWANGKGMTVEMLRIERDGRLWWRLSRASVVEDGEFSLFPGVERSLTVISGPGFDLVGKGLRLAARPLVPVSFPGDVQVRAEGVTDASDDFNVMTARGMALPEVRVMEQGDLAAGGTLAVFALGDCRVSGNPLATYDLLLTDTAVQVSGLAIAVRIHG